MILEDVKNILDAEIFSCESKTYRVVISACGADLMSDVLVFSMEKTLLITGLVNTQVIRTAEMMDIKAIILVRGKVPSDEMVALAEEKSIVLMSTAQPMFLACGLLYSNGLNEFKEGNNEATL